MPKEELRKVVEDRATCLKNFKDQRNALAECLRMIEICDPKPSDWKKQVATALMEASSS